MPKLACPLPDLSRYEYLKDQQNGVVSSRKRYFFALNLRNNLPILPRLLGSIVEAIRFLGPEYCALSIVEGNSPDGTAEVIAALQPSVSKWLETHFVLSNGIDPLGEGRDRFSSLAELRNLAVAPMLQNPESYVDATVVFINDVAICLEDILELIHQRRAQGADMACAFDWIGGSPRDGDEPVFYDSYVARSINGDLFFEIPADLSWTRATDLLWNEPTSQKRFRSHEPFQVFACWNGAVAFTAAPVVQKKVVFRSSREDKGECHHGEPQLFCKDMWFHGFGKIMTVPTINLEYSNEKGEYIKKLKGYVSRWISKEVAGDKIEWLPPPEQVKCMPTFDRQSWRPWNETLV